MPAQTDKILSGRPVAEFWNEALRKKNDQRTKASLTRALCLATIQIGSSADLELYSSSLEKVLTRFGVRHVKKICKTNEDVQRDISSLSNDRSITGILVFSPIPDSINAKLVFLNLPREKDVEGRTFIKSEPFGVFSPTAKAVMALLSYYQKDRGFVIKGKHAVMVGHSDLVGKPTAMLLSDEGATVTVCHKDTQNIQKHISDADILVVAIGKPGVIQSSWIKKGAVVIDVGENVVNGKIVGDVDLESALSVVSYISPVPGGVGPLTNLMVIDNLLTLDKYREILNGNH